MWRSFHVSFLATQSIFAANITARDWGTTSKGEKVQLFTLKTGVRHGLVVEISNFGGVVVRLMAPDREGVLRDVVLGYDSFPEYEKGGVYSALIGPYANRLSQSFKLNGQTITQPAPALRGGGRGGLILHSGAIGFQKRVWDAAMHDGREPSSPSRMPMVPEACPAMLPSPSPIRCGATTPS